MFLRMVYKSGQILLPFCHNTRVWQTDRRTDRQTDRRTDRILIARPRLHSMQRCKNYSTSHAHLYCMDCIFFVLSVYYFSVCQSAWYFY